MAEDTSEHADIKSPEEYFEKYKRDLVEMGKDQMLEVDYPKPIRRYRIVYETFQSSIEESYFWILNYLRYDMGFADIDKITDVFTAAETSAFEGVRQQRVGLQQDKVSQFLATIGKMVKELFQLVRELRIIDERVSYYLDSFTSSVSSESAEITLKGIWIDLVEGGSKNPSSVYGMARELQFTTLPDLFFSVHPKRNVDVDVIVDKLDFNRKVKEVLKRKLRTFMEWKKHTFSELKTKRKFTLKYLRHHYDVIKMYMNWVKPYLRTIKRLQYSEPKTKTPDLIAAFEGSLIEIEILGKFIPEQNKEYKACMLITFEYRTRPSMSYQAEHYQRGPLHVGEIKITFRSYAWNDKDIANYKKFKEMEDIELLGVVDASVKAAMEALGDELRTYLSEAGEFEKAFEKKPEAMPSMIGPFTSVAKGFGELFGAFRPHKPVMAVKKKMSKYFVEQEIKNCKTDLSYKTWTTYKNYKKAHKMVTW